MYIANRIIHIIPHDSWLFRLTAGQDEWTEGHLPIFSVSLSLLQNYNSRLFFIILSRQFHHSSRYSRNLRNATIILRVGW